MNSFEHFSKDQLSADDSLILL
uniref:Uncharacterized protein n=1 Tax=Anguilla anguilla TaxID=7936 RepID=A0A0E9XQE0_ANGAN